MAGGLTWRRYPLVDRYDEADADEQGLFLDQETARLQRLCPAQAAAIAALLDVEIEGHTPLTYGPGQDPFSPGRQVAAAALRLRAWHSSPAPCTAAA